MSNYCACSGGDEEYTIELNQQGPEGPQGEVGPEGFSPSISVKTSTDKAYILTVVNKEDTFDTPNLYGELEKLNADLSNIPNPAFINGVSLSSIEDNIPMITMDSSRITTSIDGNLILNATASNEETMEVSNYEVVVNPKEQRLELHDNEGTVKIVATTDYIPTIGVATTTTAGIVKPDGSTITVTPDGTISAVQQDLSNLATKEELASTDATVTNLQTSVASNTTSIGTLREDLTNLETTVGNNSADIAALDADKLEQSNIIAGTNITIDRNGNNLTINSIGGGGGGASIDDSTISSASTWSSSKINSEITTVANTKNDNIFDISKFTVVGSPTITDDGIASGFSSGNYLTTLDSINLGNNSWQFNCTINTSADVQTEQWFVNSINNTTRNITVINELNNNVPVIRVRCYVYNTDGNRYDSIQGTFNSTSNTQYKISIKYDGNSTYTFMCNNESKTVTNSYKTSGVTKIIIGKRYPSDTSLIAKGSIDLKQFSITVDGEQVFNGLMESTKPIYNKIATTNTTLSTFQTDTDNNFSAVNSALNEKANLSDLAGYVKTNGNNTFTGTNIFKGTVKFNQNLPSSAPSNTIGITSNVSMQIGSPTNVDQQCIYVARNTRSKGATYMKFGPVNSGRAVFSILRSSTINASTASTVNFSYDEDGVYYKTASSDEINLIELINTMSSTISSLTDRISALETEINGGNA